MPHRNDRLLLLYFNRNTINLIYRGLTKGTNKPISQRFADTKVTFTFTDKGEGGIYLRPIEGKASRLVASVKLDGEDIVLTDETGRVFRERETVIQENPEDVVTVLTTWSGRALTFRYGELIKDHEMPCPDTTPTEMEKAHLCAEYQPKDQPFPHLDKLYLIGDISDRVAEQLAHQYTQNMTVRDTGEVNFFPDEGPSNTIEIVCGTSPYEDNRITSPNGGWYGYGYGDRSVEIIYTVGEMVNVIISREVSDMEKMAHIVGYITWQPWCQDKIVLVQSPIGISYWKNGSEITDLVREHIGEVMGSFTDEQWMILTLIA